MPKVSKVVFVVDRRDLDYQTNKEFNSFRKGSVDGTDNTRALVKQFTDDTKLIVTTIQKLNTAISKRHFLERMESIRDERIVFIFDECHRSQFGETHQRIISYFSNIQMFGSAYSTRDNRSFYNYYNDISKKVKERKIDLLLVVNMFLTGFDSPALNTLFVDKNLRYHGLIQAYSRTNRILTELKSQGNIVVFRNLKPATDEAITLFSNKDAIEEIIMKPYEDYTEAFNLLNTEVQLRSKKELIEKFIHENLPVIPDTDDIPQEFEKFWSAEQEKSFLQLVEEEKLSRERTQSLIENYLYSEREPLRDEVLDLLEGERPTLLQRKKTGDRIIRRIIGFVETFINGMVG